VDSNIKFLTLLALALSGIVVSYNFQEETPVVEPATPPVTVQLSDVQICDALVSDTLNETYLLDNEYSAVTVWNKLKTHNFNCALVFGNLSMNNEPITSCNRLWVTFSGIAIDSGAVYIEDETNYDLDNCTADYTDNSTAEYVDNSTTDYIDNSTSEHHTSSQSQGTGYAFIATPHEEILVCSAELTKPTFRRLIP